MHEARPSRWQVTPSGAMAVTLALFAVAWVENVAVPWAPFYVLYVVFTIALPLFWRTGNLGPLGAVRGRHWALAVACGLLAQFALSGLAFGLLPRVLAAFGVGPEAAATPFWNLGAAQGAMFERLAPRWRTEPPQLQAVYLIFIVAWSGFGEEIYFRGYLHAAFGRRWRLGAVVFASALLFGARHALQLAALGGDYPWGAAAVWSGYGMLFGLVLSWLYVRTGSLWPPILAHYLFNLVPALAALAA
jgi:membrane protease YdiL (CAAX protease family)